MSRAIPAASGGKGPPLGAGRIGANAGGCRLPCHRSRKTNSFTWESGPTPQAMTGAENGKGLELSRKVRNSPAIDRRETVGGSRTKLNAGGHGGFCGPRGRRAIGTGVRLRPREYPANTCFLRKPWENLVVAV